MARPPPRAILLCVAVCSSAAAADSAAEVRAALEALREPVRTCFDHELQRDPSLRGTVEVQFTVDPAGKVREVEIPLTIAGAPALEACVRQLVSGLKLAPPRDAEAFTVVFPFVFEPAAGQPSDAQGPPEVPVIDGDLAREALMAAVELSREALSDCYEAALARDDRVEGTVRVGFRVDATGRVSRVQILQGIAGQDGLDRCVLQVTKRLKLPATKGRALVRVEYPFLFRKR